jgi:hypothetical protein
LVEFAKFRVPISAQFEKFRVPISAQFEKFRVPISAQFANFRVPISAQLAVAILLMLLIDRIDRPEFISCESIPDFETWSRLLIGKVISGMTAAAAAPNRVYKRSVSLGNCTGKMIIIQSLNFPQ